MRRDFRIFDRYTYDFIGAFNSTENEAEQNAMQMMEEFNRIRKLIGFEPYTEVFVMANHYTDVDDYSFNLSV